MEKEFNIKKKVNGFALIIITIIDMFLIVGYIQDCMAGNISVTFAAVFLIIVITSLILDYVIYFRKHDSEIFRYVSIIGYMIGYAVALFGVQNDLVFVMAFPITCMYILYFDIRLITIIAASFSLLNITDIIYMAAVVHHLPSGQPINSTSMLLQGACIVVYLIVLLQTTRISNSNNQIKMDSINQEKDKSDELLKDVLRIAELVKNNSVSANSIIAELTEATESTAKSLNEIAIGNNNTADSIEQQTEMTNSIQKMIYNTKEMSDEMIKYAEESMHAIEGGKESVVKLKTQSERIEQSNKSVSESMENLIKNAKEVEEITNQIFSISSQTNLLALNASIESARAGEAGKGFAVVAEEIRVLADQTRALTENIKNIVGELQNNADDTRETVTDVIEATEKEREYITITGEDFGNIEERIVSLNSNVTDIYSKINDIMASNNAIVDSISQISAVSQEVAASTEEAVALGESTSSKAEDTKKLMNELLNTATELDKYL